MSSPLFSPLELRGTTIPNRIMVSPMCQYSAEDRDGIATDWHHVHLGSRAVGGAGIVMAEAAAVEKRGRITPYDLGIWSQEHADSLASTTEFISNQGSIPAIQLAHAGRKASKSRPWEGSSPLQPDEGGWEVLAPSEEPYPYESESPELRKMTQADIDAFVENYRQAAEHALDAGFEIVEIHAAHGYLLHEFLSPVTNKRDDDYGGCFANRTRLVRQVAEAVRDVWPEDKPVFLRISGTDWLPDRESWTIEESVELTSHLSEIGVDLIDVSSGELHPDEQLPNVGSVSQLPLAEQVREETGSDIAVGTVGGITTPEQAEEIIGNDRADLTILAREHLRDPYFSLHAAQALNATEEIQGPPQYRRGLGF
ncbi:NADH:flavin oxidoreductase/NADH oxidase [Halorussus marinus]|uniref:NADH:flavin oxidoreductase/NADH oxidase n=1 Tax=Halorussus marinus TaxID=2505976 RepID=UPI00106DF2D2|nr:NADH:flavin oxidoreductase/NADH oxidase [Halorussus marinus]